MTHFLDFQDFSAGQAQEILSLAGRLRDGKTPSGLLNSVRIAAVFEKPSPRSELALGAGIQSLGGNFTKISGAITERPHHYAKMLGATFDVAVLRTAEHQKLTQIAQHSEIPIVNGLTNESHPCLLIADMLTIGDPQDLKVAFLGAATNIAKTYAQAAPLFGFNLVLAMPESQHEKIPASSHVAHTDDPFDAVDRAHIVVTDKWDAKETDPFLKFKVTRDLMAAARPDALFFHPMPLSDNAEEAELDVVDGPQSRVFEQGRNREYAFAAAIAWCLGKTAPGL